jgi:hypothetical protein
MTSLLSARRTVDCWGLSRILPAAHFVVAVSRSALFGPRPRPVRAAAMTERFPEAWYGWRSGWASFEDLRWCCEQLEQ